MVNTKRDVNISYIIMCRYWDKKVFILKSSFLVFMYRIDARVILFLRREYGKIIIIYGLVLYLIKRHFTSSQEE